MSYVLGSQVESMAFTDAGAEYEPAGAAHAVDTESQTYLPGAVVGYALCGAAVRVWPERPFDPDGPNVHSGCAAITCGERQPDSGTGGRHQPDLAPSSAENHNRTPPT
jgi:hypothetical protein